MNLDENERVLSRGVSQIHHVDDNTKVYVYYSLVFTPYNVDKNACSGVAILLCFRGQKLD